MQNNQNFKPYISANKITPELTATSVISGIILAVVFGASLVSCGGAKTEAAAEVADSVAVVDSVCADSCCADTVAADTVAADSVK